MINAQYTSKELMYVPLILRGLTSKSLCMYVPLILRGLTSKSLCMYVPLMLITSECGGCIWVGAVCLDLGGGQGRGDLEARRLG